MSVSKETLQEWRNCIIHFDLSAIFEMSLSETTDMLITEASNLKKYAEAILLNYKKTITFMAFTKMKPQTDDGLRNLIALSNECHEAVRSVEDIALLLFQYEFPAILEKIEEIIEWTDEILDEMGIYHSHYLNIISKAASDHNFIDINEVKSMIENGDRSKGITEIAAGIINFELSECSDEGIPKYIELRDSGKLDEFYNQNKMEYQALSDICGFDKMDPDALKKFWPWD